MKNLKTYDEEESVELQYMIFGESDTARNEKRAKHLHGKSTACCPRTPNVVDPRGHLIIDPFV